MYIFLYKATNARYTKHPFFCVWQKAKKSTGWRTTIFIIINVYIVAIYIYRIIDIYNVALYIYICD